MVQKDRIEFEIAQAIKAKLYNCDVQKWIIELILARQEHYHRVPELEMMKARKEEIKSSIKNLLNAMEAGIITPSTKDRLMELEDENSRLDESIASLESLSQKKYTKEQISEWFEVLQSGKIDDKKYQQQLFDLFLSRAYLYDDKIRLIFGFSSLDDEDSSDSDDVEFERADECAEALEAGEDVRLTSDLLHHKKRRLKDAIFYGGV